jgi:protein TonB
MQRLPSISVRRAALVVLIAGLGACTTVTEEPTPVTAPAPAATPAPAPVPPAAQRPATPPPVVVAPTAPAAAYRNIDEYKRALANHILAKNAPNIVPGDLQPLLRAVVVLQFNVDRQGNVRNIRTLRTPEAEADTLARRSLSQAGVVPVPPTALLRSDGVLEVTETWLFNNDGRFHLRSLGPKQRSS